MASAPNDLTHLKGRLLCDGRFGDGRRDELSGLARFRQRGSLEARSNGLHLVGFIVIAY